ncbi:hypothetical protein LSH36_1113g00011 [Paralvinella palmiformis]|uniref:F-box domain-containing protein n=1 Tax=Paralvinella palmiformis TaxID=53620 RepID=A0AAD9IUT2_9ANNE|nr:hypothetical protein LSH36_1113g00011 [Paralvinella palmiformis]
MAQKGILGFKKDPKHQILFSFKTREGEEWPSDDSDDSSYCPSDGSDELLQVSHAKTKKKSRKKQDRDAEYEARTGKATTKKPTSQHNNASNKLVPKMIIKKSVDDVFTAHSQEEHVVDDKQCWNLLPWQILHHVFLLLIRENGALPSLCRMSKVCKHWYEVACHPSLWSKMDFSYGWIKLNDDRLKWLCENRLTQLREVNFGTLKMMTNSSVEIVATSCPNLEHIGLSYCTKINSDGMKILVEKCPKLVGFDLSYMSVDALSNVALKHLIEKGWSPSEASQSIWQCAERLPASVQHTDCSYHTKCSDLEVLQMNKVGFSHTTLTINIESFQAGCPKLRVLELSLTSYRAPSVSAKIQAQSPGFPDLEEVCLAIDTSACTTVGLDDDFLHRLLKASTKLKLFDLRGSSSIKCHTIQCLPATDLQQLYLSLSSVAKYTGIEIIMAKWQHSLRDLDLSWNLYPGMSLDCAMHKLSDDPAKSALEVLNLSGTSITSDRVKSLLEGCPKLRTLNLCSCRGLPRGMKRKYTQDDLDQLRYDIDSIVREEEMADDNKV